MRRGRRQSGFTLLELLVAMVMVALLAGSLYASLRIVFRARDSATAAIAPVRAAHVAMDLLRKELECALPPTGELAGMFVGDNDGDGKSYVQFYAPGGLPNLDDPCRGGVRKVELALTTPDDGTPSNGTANNVLVRRVSDNLLSQIEEDPQEQVLCRGVQSFTLRYYDGSEWLDTWDSTLQDNTLPVAVEVTLDVGYPEDKDEPDEVVHVRRILTFACSTTPGALP